MYKVLIIDDEYFIREGMKQMLPWEELECEVVGEAQDGEEGIEAILKLRPDIIISDIRMPKKDGLDMIEEIKGINQNMQIIILTGFREFEYAQHAIKLGVLRFLLKPSKIDELIESIAAATSKLKLLEKDTNSEYIGNSINTVSEISEVDKVSEVNEINKPQFLVKQAVEYINENYNVKLDLQTVADALYVSTWHLCKVLKKQTGTNFVDLLNSVRIENAKKLLLESNMKIYEIAEYVGYTDTAYFSKMFKKVTKITPNEFRNKMY
ncbi:MAG: response regulator transcription factor [Cellulosilyticaceae bacterium]